jgi:hypothetical protein
VGFAQLNPVPAPSTQTPHPEPDANLAAVGRDFLDNMANRFIVPALNRCAVI